MTPSSSRLAEMAREIERRKPGSLPKSIRLHELRYGEYQLKFVALKCIEEDCSTSIVTHCIPEDFAAAIIRDACVMAAHLGRSESGYWCHATLASYWRDNKYGSGDGCPTESCFAAFCAATEKTP